MNLRFAKSLKIQPHSLSRLFGKPKLVNWSEAEIANSIENKYIMSKEYTYPNAPEKKQGQTQWLKNIGVLVAN
jgi:hypothetical protein